MKGREWYWHWFRGVGNAAFRLALYFARWLLAMKLEPKTWFRKPSQRLRVDSHRLRLVPTFVPGSFILRNTFLTSRTGVAFEADTKPRQEGGGRSRGGSCDMEDARVAAITSAIREALQYRSSGCRRAIVKWCCCDVGEYWQFRLELSCRELRVRASCCGNPSPGSGANRRLRPEK